MINNTIKSLFHSTKTVPSSNQFHNHCVCEICKCGKHHCPLHSDNMQGDFQSTFQHDYKPWKPNKQKPFNYDRKPQQHYFDPSTLKSSYQTEFISRPIPERESRQLPEIPNSLPFNTLSDYQTNYQKFPLPMKRPITKIQYKSAPRQIPWNTTYGNDFTKKPVGECEIFRPTNLGGPEVNTDFGTTTYKTSFIPLPNCKQQRCKDPIQHNIYGNPGQIGSSTYQIDFDEKPREENACPVLALPKRPIKLPGGKSHLTYDATSNRWI